MAFYDEMQAIATEFLTEFKQGVLEYGKLTPGAGPIDNPGPSSIAWKGFDGTMRTVKSKYLQDTRIVASDDQVTMPVISGLVPDMRDTFRADGVSHKIVAIYAKPAVGTVAAYVLIVRK